MRLSTSVRVASDAVTPVVEIEVTMPNRLKSQFHRPPRVLPAVHASLLI